MKRSKIARRIQPNRRIQFRQSGVAQAIAPGSTCSRHPYIGIQLAGKMSSRIPSMGQGIEPFQLMMNAKGLPTEEFADYTFVFR